MPLPPIQRALQRLSALLAAPDLRRDWTMIVLAGAVGVAAALAAVAFHALVGLSEGFFFGRIAHHEFSGWKILLLIPLPALGGLAVGLFNHFIARSPPGHGVPEIIALLAQQRGRITGRTALFKAITASLTIGSGGSAGQEGPIVHIGSAVGSKIGQVLGVDRERLYALVACGAAAGLAALFNAPIAGVVFVLEVLLRDFSLRTFMPVVVASVVSVAVARTLAFTGPIFAVPPELQHYPFTLKKIVPFAVLGVVCGLGGAAFTRVFYRVEAYWRKLRLHPAVKPALGGLLLGMLGVAFVLGFGRGLAGYQPPVFFANGYPVIEWLFNPRTYLGGATEPGLRQATLALLLLAVAGKMIGTSLTLGSGGAGGLFAPSLFIGAALGGAVGLVVRAVPGFGDVTPANFALVGMGGVLAGAVHCPLTAFLLVFEVTSDYRLILPAMLVAVLATSTARLLSRDSIYTLDLRARGLRVGAASDRAVLRRIDVGQIGPAPAVTLRPEEPASHLLELAQTHNVGDFVVCDAAGRYLGIVTGDDLRTALLRPEALPLLIVAEIMRSDIPPVEPGETLESVLEKLSRHDTPSLAIVDADRSVQGVITRARVMRHYVEALQKD